MINKILSVILAAFILNLAREYIFVKPAAVAEAIFVEPVNNLEFDNMPIKKDLEYYSSVINDESGPGYIGEEEGVVKIPFRMALRGTIVSSPQKSFAIIENLETKKQVLYRLGDTIGGAVIVSMSRNEVILDCNGVKQELGVYTAEPRLEIIENASSIKEIEPLPSVEKNQTPSDTIPKIKNAIDDFAKIFTQIRIKPYFEDGKCAGFQLSNINSDLVKRMGLRDGDIVESINGVQIDDPLKALQLLYGIQKNNPVHLQVSRGEEKIEMDCEVEG